jgi:hypothetical protein
MKLLTLIEIELKKLLPILLIVFFVVVAGSCFFFYRSASQMNNVINQAMIDQSLTLQEYVKANGQVTIMNLYDVSNFLPVYLIGGLILIIAMFYLWYKEWFGVSKRIYMLLSLKGSRISIILSKWISIIIATLIYFGIIIASIYIGVFMMNQILPNEIFNSMNISDILVLTELNSLLPINIQNLSYDLLFASALFLGISVIVLLNRTSKKILGTIIGSIYCIVLLVMFIITKQLWLFTDERLIVDFAYITWNCLLSFLIARLVIKRNISI